MSIFSKISKRWSILSLVIVFLLSIPTLSLVIKVGNGPGESWSHIVDFLLWDYIQNSFFLLISCTILCIFMGVIPAWLVSYYDFPLRRNLEWMLILPLAIPNYLMAYAYSGIFDYSGAVQEFIVFLSMDTMLPKIDIMNIWGLSFVLSISLYPYVYIGARNYFLHQSSAQIQVARTLGTSEFNIFRKVAFPMARPAIVGAMLLVFMEVLSDYGAAHYFGVSTFSTAIFRSWFGLEEPETAIYLAVLLCVFILSLIGIEKLQRRNKKYSLTQASIEIKKVKVDSKYKSLSFVILCITPVCFGFIAPISQMIYWSYLTASEVWNSDFIGIILDSFFVALLASVVSVTLAYLILYSSKWSRSDLMISISKLSITGYAIPGVVIGIGILIPSLFFDKAFVLFAKENLNWSVGFVITGTSIGLLFAYLVRFFAIPYNTLEASLEKNGDRLEQVSQVLGVNKIKRSLKINIPITKTAIFTSWMMVFVEVSKELPLTLLLKPYGLMTLSVKAYEYAGDEMIAESSLPSLIIVALGLIPIFFLNKLMKR